MKKKVCCSAHCKLQQKWWLWLLCCNLLMSLTVFNKNPTSMDAYHSYIVVFLKLSTKVHTHTHSHKNTYSRQFPVCYTLPPLFFVRSCTLLHLSSSDVSWFCIAAVTPVYHSAMRFSQLPSFHSWKTWQSLEQSFSYSSPLTERLGAIEAYIPVSSPSSALQHNHRSEGGAFLPW